MEDDSDLFEYLEAETEQQQETEEDTTSFEGICDKCLNTEFVITVRNGVMGVLYTSANQDSSGKPIKQLTKCGHDLEINY